MDKTNWNSRLYLWRPEKKIKNRIRIMPEPEGAKAKWWMRVDIHVVHTIYERQQFICNKQLFDLSCKLCNMKKRLKRQDKLKEAEEIVLRRYSFLNIIGREREAEGVKVWMAPISAWNWISRHYFKEENPVEYFDTPPNEERGREYWRYGHDLNVFYRPNQEPFLMYYVEPPHFDDEPTPLGTEEQREIWASEVLPLLPENYYDPIELKDEELKLLEEGIVKLVSWEEFRAYMQTPEYEAEMAAMRDEKERKKVEEEARKKEIKKLYTKWRKMAVIALDKPFEEISDCEAESWYEGQCIVYQDDLEEGMKYFDWLREEWERKYGRDKETKKAKKKT